MRFLSFLCVFVLLFNSITFASEVESTTDEYETSDLHDALYSLQDCLDDIPQAMQQLREVATSFGQAADSTISTLVNAPVKAVISSFAAVRDDVRDTFVDTLKNNRDFMRSIFINPYTKSFEWGRDAGRHGGAEGSKLFSDTVFYDVPAGFYKCDDTNKWPSWGTHFQSADDCFFTAIGVNAVVCSGLSASKTCRFDCVYTLPGQSTLTTSYSRYLESSYIYNGIDYKYWYGSVNTFQDGFSSTYKTYYSDVDSAVRAFYSFSPHSEEKPNGKGYLREVNVNINASGHNVYNQNWDEIINNNYITYGDTFNTTTINYYYYNVSSSDTPNYWYDIYPVENTLPVENTYDDLDDITLSDYTVTTDNSFITAFFNALPVGLSTIVISLFILSAVLIFLRG